MMITVNRIGDSITGQCGGKPYGVSFNEQRYVNMKALEKSASEAKTFEEIKAVMLEFEPLTKETYGSLLETKSPYLVQDATTRKFHLRLKDKVSTEAIHQVIVDKLIEAVDKNLDIDPLIKCWSRFLRNPNYSPYKAGLFAYYIMQKTRDQKFYNELIQSGLDSDVANERSTVYQTPITMEGLISTYKVSAEIDWKYQKSADGKEVEKVDRQEWDVDEITGLKKYIPVGIEQRIFQPASQRDSGDAFYCYAIGEASNKHQTAGHIIKVGFVHELPDWKMVDCNDNHSCVPGLHCGNLDYIRAYQHAGTVTHHTFVDPMDIGAVVQDNTGALRVRKYFTYGSFAGVTKTLYHSSDYAKLNDAEYEDMVRKAIAVSETTLNEMRAKADADVENKKALLNL